MGFAWHRIKVDGARVGIDVGTLVVDDKGNNVGPAESD